MPTGPSAFTMALTTIGMVVIGALFVVGLFAVGLAIWRMLSK